MTEPYSSEDSFFRWSYHFSPDYVSYSLHGLYVFKEIEQNAIILYEYFNAQIYLMSTYGSCSVGYLFMLQQLLTNVHRLAAFSVDEKVDSSISKFHRS